MKFANLLTKFYFEAWAIRPDKHISMGRLLQQHLAGKLPANLATPPVSPEALLRLESEASVGSSAAGVVGPTWEDGSPVIPQMEIRNGIALIPVSGVLGKRLSFLELWCGGCDYEHISEMIDLALEDVSVHTVIFNFNSPGGMVIGMAELGEKIKAAGEMVNTIAYADMVCCSAAMWLAVCCNEIYFAPSAAVGSIGVYMAGLDVTREWEMLGWKLELFQSGALKGVGIEGKAWTDEERKFLQARVDRDGARFRSHVRSRRGDVADSTMQGQWFDGSECVALGLCDRVVPELKELIVAVLSVEM